MKILFLYRTEATYRALMQAFANLAATEIDARRLEKCADFGNSSPVCDVCILEISLATPDVTTRLQQPFIVCSNRGPALPEDESLAIAAGAAGYVALPEASPAEIERTLQYAINAGRSPTARKHAVLAAQDAGALLAQLAHDFRSPLNGIVIWCELIRESCLQSATLKKGLEAIETGVSVQKLLLDELSDMIWIFSGTAPRQVESMALAPLVEKAVAAVHPMALSKNISLSVACETMSPVLANSQWLDRAFSNLYMHCLSCSNRDKEIRLHCSRAGERIILTFEDEGVSFLPEQQHSDAPAGTTPKRRDKDRRLIVARYLLVQQAGELQLHSDPAQGTSTIRVSLPVAPD